MPDAPDYTIAVLGRAFDLLEALAGADGVGVTELARRTGTTKSAVYRILATLEPRGYVTKSTADATYRLGPRLAYLGRRSLDALDLRTQCRPLLEALHREFRETVNLGVRDGDSVVYIDMIESDQGLRMAARLGGRDILHATALGKVFLAFMPDAERDRLLSAPLVRRTAQTIDDPGVLRAELARIRATGVAQDRGENEDGARCLGAPIFDRTGAVVAAVSISAPESRLDDTRAAAVAHGLREIAREMTRRIGGRADTVPILDEHAAQPASQGGAADRPLIPPTPPGHARRRAVRGARQGGTEAIGDRTAAKGG